MGNPEGCAVGTPVGLDVGDALGGCENVGTAEGLPVGTPVGRYVGVDVGTMDGFEVGAVVGVFVGALVGGVVGSDVGRDVGSRLGLPVGSGVGSDVGTDVGTSLGFGLGTAVGDVVVSAFVKTASSSTLYQRREAMVLISSACSLRVQAQPGQRVASLSEGEQMGSPEVLARATGSAAERACSSKSVIKQGDPADRPLAGAPSRFGPAQRTLWRRNQRYPPTPLSMPQDGYRVLPGLQVRLEASILLRSAEAGC